jgi:glycolate oxidase FAD binding subunit
MALSSRGDRGDLGGSPPRASTVTADLNVARKALAGISAPVREGSEADAIGRVVPSLVASPASVDEASALLRTAAEHALTVVPRGGGSRLGWGTPVTSCDLLVDMGRMDAVVEHTAGDLVARVQAGARMGDVASVLARAGQEIALDVPPSATVGGVVASALAGPRRLRYGSPRDLLIGVTIVRADGTVAHSGGKVVKNVAGYDLGKLFAGSQGTLGLIAEATFRLHPLPAARAFVTSSHESGRDASRAVAAAAASPLVASAVELRRRVPGGPIQVGVLLEGSADGVAARASRMMELLGSDAVTSPEPPEWWPGVKRAPGGGTLIQVSFWVSALESVLSTVDAAAGEHSVAPAVGGTAGAGVVYVGLGPAADAGAAGRFVGALRERLSHARGGVVVLTAPSPVRGALDDYGGMTGPVPSLRLMRAVRDQFDPDHRMSPGRFFPEVRRGSVGGCPPGEAVREGRDRA